MLITDSICLHSKKEKPNRMLQRRYYYILLQRCLDCFENAFFVCLTKIMVNVMFNAKRQSERIRTVFIPDYRDYVAR